MSFLGRPPYESRSHTHEARGWWIALALRHIPSLYLETRRLEFAGLDDKTIERLNWAGVTCIRMLRTMPTWLLRTVPGIGSKGIDEIRRVYPFYPEAWRDPCPTAAIIRAEEAALPPHQPMEAAPTYGSDS